MVVMLQIRIPEIRSNSGGMVDIKKLCQKIHREKNPENRAEGNQPGIAEASSEKEKKGLQKSAESYLPGKVTLINHKQGIVGVHIVEKTVSVGDEAEKEYG